jgi:hypothetical protein
MHTVFNQQQPTQVKKSKILYQLHRILILKEKKKEFGFIF